MKTWFFTEDAYPYLPDPAEYESIRVNLPNRNYDPVKGADLYHMYLDMWLAAEEHGLEIMVNEHHQTATCVVPAAPLLLAILARQSKTARLLILGNPLPNRNQPVRVAEEMAMIDVISRGRLECGFVRSVPWEAAAANITAHRGVDRLWEAHDLILKAWTTHDGPFNFEGRYYRHRPTDPDRLAYAALVYVAETEAKAREGAEKNLWYMRSNKVTPHHSNPPGYHAPDVAVNFMKGADSIVPQNPSLVDQMARGNVFAGTPDQVYEQIKTLYEYAGGFGHLIMMGQAGFLTMAETLGSLKLYAKEVVPRLKELVARHDHDRMQELRAATPDRQLTQLGSFGLEFAR